MANTVLTPTIIAKEALMILENECVMGKLVYRGYESEFDKNYNGYSVGQTINVRRPTDFVVRTGRTASVQDVTEGSFVMTVNTQIGVDFQFTSQDLTQTIRDLSERVIKPAVIQLANKIDSDLTALYSTGYNWVNPGAAASTINSFDDFAEGPKRLDQLGVPQDARAAVLSPVDYWAMAGSQTALFLQNIGNPAYKKAEIGMIGGVNTWLSQNVASHTRGTAVTCTVNSLFTTSYASTLNSNTMSIALEFAASRSIETGAVFTLSGVNAVNPVTKANAGYLQQFVVVGGAAGGTGAVTVTITPPIITSGAFQTVTAAPTASSSGVFVGSASAVYNQNLVFHKNAMALCVAPLVMPQGSVDGARESYKGYSVRVIPYYSGSNDISAWRLDVLYGAKLLDPRLLVRLNGA